MKIQKFILPIWVWFTATTTAHEISPSSYHDDKLSLPNLMDKISKSQLSEWDFFNDFKLDTGRLLVEQNGMGSLWNKNPLNYNEWTVEYTFRSSGGSHLENGLSFWLINADDSLSNNFDNVGGPSRYDGLQLFINNKNSPGLKAYLNDGTKDFVNDIDASFGNCVFNYQNSQVPLTIRVSYKKNWLKVQVDNNLCFRTDKIKIPFNHKLGISAASVYKETFELLRFNVYGSVTNDAIDDHGIISPQISYKTITKQQPEPTQSPMDSLIEKTKKQREAIQKEAQSHQFDAILSKLDNLGSADKIDLLLHKLENQPVVTSNGELSYDSKVMESYLKELTQQVSQNQQKIDSLTDSLRTFQSKMDLQYSNLIKSLDELTKNTIKEIREHQYVSEELSKKIDILTLDHKESSFQKALLSTDSFDKLENFLNKMKWVLIPLVVLIIFLSYSIYRLRHDVKHSKLL